MRLSSIIFVILLILPFVIAEETDSFDVITSYDWLSNNTVIGDNPRESALALLALNNQGYDITDNLNEFIGGNSCWPASSCTITDTAFGLLLLDKTSQSADLVNQTVSWLMSKEKAAGSIGGKWIIQLATTATGNCDITSGSVTKKVSASPTQGWIDISNVAPMGSDTKSKTYSVDCADLGDPNMHISLLYNIDTPQYKETFLIQDEQTQQKEIIVNNACFPKISGTTCDLDSTLYATWVLTEIGEEVHTIPYLEERLSEIASNPLKLSLLYLITKSPAYANMLRDKQKASGSWVDDVYSSSFAALAMLDGNTESYLNVTNWLNLKRDKKDFSWNHKIVDTAMALIALRGSIEKNYVPLSMEATETEICTDLIDNDEDGYVDCDDPDCDLDSMCACSSDDECISDGDCGTGYSCDMCVCVKTGCSIIAGDECESDYDCLGDNKECYSCSCIEKEPEIEREICDDDEDNDGDGDIDCKDDECEYDEACEKSYVWIWILLILLLLGGGGAYYYFEFYKKGKKIDFSSLFGKKSKTKTKTFEEYVAQKESSRPIARPEVKQTLNTPVQRQPFTQRPQKKDSVDDALEKSLEEARRLLGKAQK